jgi:hypothetical protein
VRNKANFALSGLAAGIAHPTVPGRAGTLTLLRETKPIRRRRQGRDGLTTNRLAASLQAGPTTRNKANSKEQAGGRSGRQETTTGPAPNKANLERAG